jgi:hypothetical protein
MTDSNAALMGAVQEKKMGTLTVSIFDIAWLPDLDSNRDLRINSPSLYRLSYRGKEAEF